MHQIVLIFLREMGENCLGPLAGCTRPFYVEILTHLFYQCAVFYRQLRREYDILYLISDSRCSPILYHPLSPPYDPIKYVIVLLSIHERFIKFYRLQNYRIVHFCNHQK